MRILLDENLPHGLRTLLPDHEVWTVDYAGWKGLRNGELLSTAAAAGVEVLLTVDTGLGNEWRGAEPPLLIVLMRARGNAIQHVQHIKVGGIGRYAFGCSNFLSSGCGPHAPPCQ